jgi:hypothetical protein
MNSDFAKQAFDQGYEDTLVALGLVTAKQASLQKEALPFIGAMAKGGMGLLQKGMGAVGRMFGNKGVQQGVQQAGQQAGQQAAKPGMLRKLWNGFNSTPAQAAMIGASSIPTN